MVAASYSKMVLPTFIVWPRAWSLWTKWMLNRMNVLTHANVVLLTMCQLVKQAKYELSFHCTFNHAYDTNWCPNDCAAMFVSSTVMNCKKRFAIRTCTAQSECKQVMEQTIAFQWDVKQMTHTSGNTRLLCVAFKSTVSFFFFFFQVCTNWLKLFKHLHLWAEAWVLTEQAKECWLAVGTFVIFCAW